MRWIQGWGIVVREVLAGGEEGGAACRQLRQVGTESPFYGKGLLRLPAHSGWRALPAVVCDVSGRCPNKGESIFQTSALLWCQTAKPVSIIQHQGCRIFGSFFLLCLTSYWNINESTHCKNLP